MRWISVETFGPPPDGVPVFVSTFVGGNIHNARIYTCSVFRSAANGQWFTAPDGQDYSVLIPEPSHYAYITNPMSGFPIERVE